MKAQHPSNGTASPERDLSSERQGQALERNRPQVPPVDIYETKTAVVMVADVPGVDQDGIDITLDRGVMTLRAKTRQAPPQGFQPVYQEYQASDFERQFTLSDAIDTEAISATVVDGVLRIELPKAKQAVPRKIVVKAG